MCMCIITFYAVIIGDVRGGVGVGWLLYAYADIHIISVNVRVKTNLSHRHIYTRLY